MKPSIAVCAALVLLTACKPAGQAAPTAAPEAAAPPTSTPATAQPASYFYFGNHVPRAAIVSVEGADTASAKLTGQTSAQDNFDYCVGYPDPADAADAAARCADQKAAPPPDVMTANCIEKTVSDGSDAKWIRDDAAEGGKVQPVWQDVESGQMRDYSGAGGGYVLTAAFRILCPTASANIAPDPT